MTSTHDDVLAMLADARGGPLPDEAAAHVAACDECRAVASALAVLARDEAAAASFPPDGYWQELDEALALRLARPQRRPRTTAVVLLAASVVLVLAAGALVLERRGGGTPTAPVRVTLEDVAREDPEALLAVAASLTGADDVPAAEDLAALVPADDAPSDDAAFVLPLADPLEALDAELERLDADAAARLAESIRQEMKS